MEIHHLIDTQGKWKTNNSQLYQYSCLYTCGWARVKIVNITKIISTLNNTKIISLHKRHLHSLGVMATNIKMFSFPKTVVENWIKGQNTQETLSSTWKTNKTQLDSHPHLTFPSLDDILLFQPTTQFILIPLSLTHSPPTHTTIFLSNVLLLLTFISLWCRYTENGRYLIHYYMLFTPTTTNHIFSISRHTKHISFHFFALICHHPILSSFPHPLLSLTHFTHS